MLWRERRGDETVARGTVLVIDDDPFTVDVVTFALEDEGYAVVSGVGAAGLELARQAHPDVILLDVMMPGMDGLEVGKHLRASPETAAIPIVLMSTQDRMGSSGVLPAPEARLPKPFPLGKLCDTVARLMPVAS